ncbi:hypothetical protein BV494_15670 [Rahnella sikkimica]|uniref:Novel toxin 16 domain-containing protein n=1 Tax=Rahnella sikkimica TaxID=1805933 RepID=A0A2L1UTQ2_9GAMM|nr:RHS repeat-associated core domain-containing protein [Rahnella sikkimica]AVF36277.1 hypothetical protein BV494_15670 [Rahnella sikkimica]
MDVWGNAVDVFNPYKLRQPIRMQGQHYDEESGLHYNRHRYYDPMLGRYITQDLIGLRGGWNLYAYVINKPLKYSYPKGLCVEDACILEGAAAIAIYGLLMGAAGNQGSQGKVNTDDYGRAVDPEAEILTENHQYGINRGGNCTPDDLSALQAEKNKLCNQSRACAPQMNRSELFRRYELNLACGSVRKQINNQCFSGGDKNHMNEENKAYKTAADCSGLMK